MRHERGAAVAASRTSSTRRASNSSVVFSRSSSVDLSLPFAASSVHPRFVWWKLGQRLLLVAVFVELLVLPYLIAFQAHVTMQDPIAPELGVIYACECLFAIELVARTQQTLRVAFNRRKACVRLLQMPSIWLEVFVLVPLSLLAARSNVSRATFEVHKLLRVFKMRQFASAIDDAYAKHFVALKLFEVLVVTVLLSHFVACARFSLGAVATSSDDWVHSIEEPTNKTLTVHGEYLAALFWSFGLLTGLFEGELPRTIGEFAFTITVALCGFALFTYLCATFFMISRSESAHTTMAEARISQFQHVLAFHRVPETLQEQAIGYLKSYYTCADANDREALRLLCPSIAKDIQVALLQDTIAQIPFFLGCNAQFIIAITSLLEIFALPAGAIVFEANDVGDAMYVVNAGVVHVLIDNEMVQELRKGSCFGELALFLHRPRSATVVAATYCTLYQLLRINVERVLEGYPQYARSIPNKVEKLAKDLVGFRPERKLAVRAPRDPWQSLSTSSSLPKQQSQARPGRLRASGSFGHRGKRIPKGPTLADLHEAEPQSISNARAFVCSLCGLRGRRRPLIALLLLKKAIDPASRVRMWWLLTLVAILLYNWTVVPVQLCFVGLDASWWPLVATNTLTDALLWIDIVFSCSLSYDESAEKIVDTRRTALHYARSGGLAADLLCALPYSWLSVRDVSAFAMWRIPRLVRVWRVWGHYREADAYLRFSNKQRLALLALLLLVLYHFIACLYFSVTLVQDFSDDHDAWLPTADISLRRYNSTHFVTNDGSVVSDIYSIVATQYLRSLYFAANILTALGRTIEPASDMQYIVALAFMLSGFVITAVVVDNVQKRYTASAPEHQEFLATRLKVQLFLRRQHAPLSIHQRVNSFLDFWWSAHRGAVIGEILHELPTLIRRDILHSICSPALQTIALLQNVRPVLDELEHALLDHVQFVLYGQGEVIYRQGDHATSLFFLLEGAVVTGTQLYQCDVPPGGFFGSVCLIEDGVPHCYEDTAMATTGCVVLLLPKHSVHSLQKCFPTFASALLALQARLHGTKIAKRGATKRLARRSTLKQLWSASRTIAQVNGIIDPDSRVVAYWEFIVFIAMSVQALHVVFRACFGVPPDQSVAVEVATACLELPLVVDIVLRTRLGFYDFGNKVMDRRLVRRHYLCSRAFLLDAAAALPLFVFNWAVSVQHRTQLVNVNKLLRLLHVPRHFASFESKFLTHSLELRLTKLVYYTFLLSHCFGCVWFSFAAQPGSGSPAFGQAKWLPSADLATAPVSRQYAASLFWAFGLMSASSPGELPKTPGQCAFSVLTMTTGFFLFAYVVGNFTNMLELRDADNRAFYAQLSSLRHFLAHFHVAKPLAHKFTTYLRFRRFHSITQEHLLARSLPPSLLADIRMVHLQPMIARVSFLTGMDVRITRLLVTQFNQVLVVRQEYVYKLGDHGSDMYFVFTGLLHSLLPQDTLAREAEILDRRHSHSLYSMHSMMPDFADSHGVNNDEDTSRIRTLTRDNLGSTTEVLRSVEDIVAGSYFGENALVSTSARSSYVQAKTSCILYTLSRQSLELAFERFPAWKVTVLRSMTIHQEQQMLARMEQKELQHETSPNKRRMATFTAKLEQANALAEQTEADVLGFLQPRRSLFRRRRTRVHSMEYFGRRSRKRTRPSTNPFWTLFTGAPAQSRLHLVWIYVVVCAALVMAFLVPYRIAFESLMDRNWVCAVLRELEVLCDVIFIADVVVNLHLQESVESMELYEQEHRVAYKRERLVLDVLTFLPFDYLFSEVGRANAGPWWRINRCLKMRHFLYYADEVRRDSISIELHRLVAAATLYVVLIYWTACLYFTIATKDGYVEAWDDWVPASSLGNSTYFAPGERRALRLLRSLFFATTALVKKGRTFTPTSTEHLVFSIAICFGGLLLMAFMIGEIAGLVISYLGHEAAYRRHHIAVESSLSRWKITGNLRYRAQTFLSSLWTAHRGVDYQQLLDAVPQSIRTEAILEIVNESLTSFLTDVCCPLTLEDNRSSRQLRLLRAVARLLRFESYSREENVLVEGSMAQAMYFVVRGALRAHSHAHAHRIHGVLFKPGDYFGERGLLGYSISAFSVRSIRSCDLMSLSAAHLVQALQSDPVTSDALALAERAVQTMRRQDPLVDSHAMEERWGQSLIAALDTEQSDEPVSENTIHGSRYSSCGGRLPDYTTIQFGSPQEAIKRFRSLLELLVPHGAILNFGNAWVFGNDLDKRPAPPESEISVTAGITSSALPPPCTDSNSMILLALEQPMEDAGGNESPALESMEGANGNDTETVECGPRMPDRYAGPPASACESAGHEDVANDDDEQEAAADARDALAIDAQVVGSDVQVPGNDSHMTASESGVGGSEPETQLTASAPSPNGRDDKLSEAPATNDP
ncbi:TPA: hypothetical protein N0F65_010621 [Lagenidium giganteum]|uniref:Cyclic nucleotide-binding domain-containing protein n=1 Tax=Lagenidium giganteum TaxID=4803 RepID=A0AAV2ZAH6_9STRA|nr:TPA: hypothetical protein N0F65_010621 [Lagenidium giganteum]